MMSLTEQSIRNALEIKDSNIHFVEDSSYEVINGRLCLVFPAILTYQMGRCSECGYADSIVKYGFNDTLVIAPSQSSQPTYLRLKRQRFLCRVCTTHFTAQTDYVWPHCQIAQPVRQMILVDAMTNVSYKDIAAHYHVSDKTVQRIVDMEAQRHSDRQVAWLPKHMAFDEFKATNSMSFIWADSDTHKIGAILPLRTSYALRRYFERFSLAARQAVETITVDLNAGYVNLIPRLFPKAKIIIDRFHIVQMINRALNQTRIQVMKTLPKHTKGYRFMKREWKQFLRSSTCLEKRHPSYHKSVDYYETDWNLLTECLALDDTFRLTYETYQTLLEACCQKDVLAFSACLQQYRKVNGPMDMAIASLRRYHRQALNAIDSPYSNGFLEGTIGRIKKIKNTAYGYRNWYHFIDRIKLQMVWYQTSVTHSVVA